MSSYLLLQSGDRALLQDGTYAIALEDHVGAFDPPGTAQVRFGILRRRRVFGRLTKG